MPTRVYIRVDPDLRRRKASYTDAQFRAFVEVLCLAEEQPRRGRFESRRLLGVLLGPRARQIPSLIDLEDLVLGEKGELYVDGWDEWQEGDVTVHERRARLNARRVERGSTNGTVPQGTVGTVPNTTVGTVPLARATSGGVSGGGGDRPSGTTTPYPAGIASARRGPGSPPRSRPGTKGIPDDGPVDPAEAARFAEAARATRAALLADGTVAPTREGDEELLREELARRFGSDEPF